MARYSGPVAALLWGLGLSLVGATVRMGGRTESTADGGSRDVPMTFLESQGRGVWLMLSIVGVTVPLVMLALRWLPLRQAVFGLACLGVLVSTASVGLFYLPWLLAMLPAILPKPGPRSAMGSEGPPGFGPARMATWVERFQAGDYPMVCARSGLPADDLVPIEAARRAPRAGTLPRTWGRRGRRDDRLWGRLPFASGHVDGIVARWDRRAGVVTISGVHPAFIEACRRDQADLPARR
jgi:hypothetical protein